ncbi:MAG TPA: hypothetical protein VF544_06145 [Pyrinomonadaceae bacterium]|jgi:hypothetical protein
MNLKSKLVARLRPTPSLVGALKHCLFVLLFFTLLFFAFFSPVLFSGDHLLAPGDGLNYHVAAYYSPRVFWDTMLLGGTPLFADPQIMMWYPPEMILCLIPGSWNFFVVSAYVMASCFAYGYSYAVTGSRLGALVSGIVYGMSGFMMAHLGHTTIIHSAAWMPLIVWSFEMMRRRMSAGWFTLCCLAVTCCLLAGHSQIFFYSLALAGCYVLVMGWRAPVGRWRYYLLAALVVCLGLGLAAIQLIPTAELARLSLRAELRFIDFVTFSIPRRQLLMLIYPVLFGGIPSWGPTAYFGEWNITELASYVGLLPLMLAAVGLFARGRRKFAIFWLCAGTVALLLAMGEATPLARIVYRLPFLGLFRAQARHVVELALAVSVLAGIGVSSLERRETSRRLVLIVVSAGALLMLASLFFIHSRLDMYSNWKGVGGVKLLPWANPTIGVPVLVFLAAAAAFLFWAMRPKSIAATILLLAVLVIDLGTFGWTYEWHFRPPNTNLLASPLFAESYKATLLKEHQRFYPALGALGPPTDLPPNLSRMWGIPSASGYGPLTLIRPSQLVTMGAAGSLGAPWRNTSDQSLNLMAVRYLFVSPSELVAAAAPAQTKEVQGVTWATEDINLWVGVGCVPEALPSSLKFKLPKPAEATSIALVSKLGCSTAVADGTEVARILITDREGNVQTLKLLAGRDSAEWLADCADVKPQMRHQPAQVFTSFRMEREKACDAHNYLTRFSLDGSREVSSVKIQWTGPGASIAIDKVSLVNEQTRASMPLTSTLIEGGPWRHVEDIFNTSVYENGRAMPRAWLVTDVAQLRPEEALRTIKTAKLPEGRAFDPSQTAIVEESFEQAKQAAVASAAPTAAPAPSSAEVLRLKDSIMEVRTTSPAPAFLVTSDVFYPGWAATVDGAPVQLFQTDYALRGVWVPAGTHLVRFTYRPRSFYYGAGTSALSLLALACAALLLRRARARPK